MSDLDKAETTLRAGLRALPIPDPGPEFDARVLAAVRERRRSSGWRAFFAGWSTALRPVLGGAACSTLVMGVLLRGLTATPTAALIPAAQAASGDGAPVFVAALASPAALDAVLERGGDLSVASFTGGQPALLRAPAPRPRLVSPPPPPRTRKRGAALPGLPFPRNGATA